MPPTPETITAPRAFVENIDTANEEIARLDASIATLKADNATQASELATAKTDLNLANEAKTKAETDLNLANEAKTKAETDLKATNEALTASNLKVDQGKIASVKAAAAAGVAPIADASVTGVQKVDERKAALEGKTGLQRAIAANTALQQDKVR